MNATIEVRDLTRSFGETRALDGVSFTVPAGTVLALLGPNGAGKTTVIRVLTTLIRPDGGHARVGGLDVVTQAAQLRHLIGLAGQYAAVDELLTGRENLELIGLWNHLPKPEYRGRAQQVLDRFGLVEAADRLVKTYSGGMRRRLDIGASLIARPPVVFLDEPTTGLDPRTRNDLWAFVEELVADGTTVLLTSQYMEEAERLADDIVILDRGRVIANGSADQLKARLGGDTLQIRVSDPADLTRASGLLSELAGTQARVDSDQQLVTVATNTGSDLLLAAGRRLQDEHVALLDIALRRPSLDDVFLTLTGGSTTPAQRDRPADRPAVPA